MATWWTSDTHFSHRNIIRYTDRPFSGVDDMNSVMIGRWNERVAADDTVWHLGDLALGSDFQRQLELTASLNGTRLLVPGNHDRVASFFEGGDKRAQWWSAFEDAGWRIMPEEFEHEIAGRAVLVSHFPYAGDSHSSHDRYPEQRPIDRGLPLLHGHVHTEFAERGRQFNVGVDVRGFAPVPESEIVGWLATVT